MGLFSGIAKIFKSVAIPLATGFLAGPMAGINAFSTAQQNAQAQKNVENQMAFQQYNSNTAYQRAMQDMQAAGLNPMLAYQQGGASTPSGASAPVEDVIGPAISSAMQLKRTSAEIENMEATNSQIASNTALNKSLQVKAGADAANANANTIKTLQEVGGGKSQAEWNERHPNLIGWKNTLSALTGGMTGPLDAAHSAKNLVSKPAAPKATRGIWGNKLK